MGDTSGHRCPRCFKVFPKQPWLKQHMTVCFPSLLTSSEGNTKLGDLPALASHVSSCLPTLLTSSEGNTKLGDLPAPAPPVSSCLPTLLTSLEGNTELADLPAPAPPVSSCLPTSEGNTKLAEDLPVPIQSEIPLHQCNQRNNTGISIDNNDHKCPICSVSFSMHFLLKQHMVLMHQNSLHLNSLNCVMSSSCSSSAKVPTCSQLISARNPVKTRVRKPTTRPKSKTFGVSCPLCYTSRHKYKSFWHLHKHMNSKHPKGNPSYRLEHTYNMQSVVKEDQKAHNKIIVDSLRDKVASDNEKTFIGTHTEISEDSFHPIFGKENSTNFTTYSSECNIEENQDLDCYRKTSLIARNGGEENQPLKCPFCSDEDAFFSDVHALSVHTLSKHSPDLHLSKCGLKSALDVNQTIQDLKDNYTESTKYPRSPLKLYLFKCHKCSADGIGKVFKSYEGFTNHIKKHHQLDKASSVQSNGNLGRISPEELKLPKGSFIQQVPSFYVHVSVDGKTSLGGPQQQIEQYIMCKKPKDSITHMYFRDARKRLHEGSIASTETWRSVELQNDPDLDKYVKRNSGSEDTTMYSDICSNSDSDDSLPEIDLTPTKKPNAKQQNESKQNDFGGPSPSSWVLSKEMDSKVCKKEEMIDEKHGSIIEEVQSCVNEKNGFDNSKDQQGDENDDGRGVVDRMVAINCNIISTVPSERIAPCNDWVPSMETGVDSEMNEDANASDTADSEVKPMSDDDLIPAQMADSEAVVMTDVDSMQAEMANVMNVINTHRDGTKMTDTGRVEDGSEMTMNGIGCEVDDAEMVERGAVSVENGKVVNSGSACVRDGTEVIGDTVKDVTNISDTSCIEDDMEMVEGNVCVEDGPKMVNTDHAWYRTKMSDDMNESDSACFEDDTEIIETDACCIEYGSKMTVKKDIDLVEDNTEMIKMVETDTHCVEDNAFTETKQADIGCRKDHAQMLKDAFTEMKWRNTGCQKDAQMPEAVGGNALTVMNQSNTGYHEDDAQIPGVKDSVFTEMKQSGCREDDVQMSKGDNQSVTTVGHLIRTHVNEDAVITSGMSSMDSEECSNNISVKKSETDAASNDKDPVADDFHYTFSENSLGDQLIMIQGSPSSSGFKCKLCHQRFSKDILPLVHMRSHFKKQNYHCSFCPFKSSFKSAMLQHVKTSHNVNQPKGVKRKFEFMNQEIQEDSCTPSRSKVIASRYESSSGSAKKWCHQEKTLLKSLSSYDQAEFSKFTPWIGRKIKVNKRKTSAPRRADFISMEDSDASTTEDQTISTSNDTMGGQNEDGDSNSNLIISFGDSLSVTQSVDEDESKDGTDTAPEKCNVEDRATDITLSHTPYPIGHQLEDGDSTSKVCNVKEIANNAVPTSMSSPINHQSYDCTLELAGLTLRYLKQLQNISPGTAIICGVCNARVEGRRAALEHAICHTGERPYRCKHCKVYRRTLQQMKYHLVVLHRVYDPNLPPWHGNLLEDSVAQQTNSVRSNKFQSGISMFNTIHHPTINNPLGVNHHQQEGVIGFQTSHCAFVPSRALHDVLIKLSQKSLPRRCQEIPCVQAGKKIMFHSLQSLFQHTVYHTSESPYICGHCEYKTKKLSLLNNHMQTIHPRILTDQWAIPPVEYLINCFEPLQVKDRNINSNPSALTTSASCPRVPSAMAAIDNVESRPSSLTSSASYSKEPSVSAVTTNIISHPSALVSSSIRPVLPSTLPAKNDIEGNQSTLIDGSSNHSQVPCTLTASLAEQNQTASPITNVQSLLPSEHTTSLLQHQLTPATPTQQAPLPSRAMNLMTSFVIQHQKSQELTTKTTTAQLPQEASMLMPLPVTSNLHLSTGSISSQRSMTFSMVNDKEGSTSTHHDKVSESTLTVDSNGKRDRHLQKYIMEVDFIYSPSKEEKQLVATMEGTKAAFLACPSCTKVMKSDEIVRHLRKHENSKPYSCYHCSFKSEFYGKIAKHLQTSHLENESVSKNFHICNSRNQQYHEVYFKASDSMLRGAQVYHCNTCNFISRVIKSMRQHVVNFHKFVVGLEKNPCMDLVYQCIGCKETLYFTPSMSFQHRCRIPGTHNKEKRSRDNTSLVYCQFCEFATERKEVMKEHLSVIHNWNVDKRRAQSNDASVQNGRPGKDSSEKLISTVQQPKPRNSSNTVEDLTQIKKNSQRSNLPCGPSVISTAQQPKPRNSSNTEQDRAQIRKDSLVSNPPHRPSVVSTDAMPKPRDPFNVEQDQFRTQIRKDNLETNPSHGYSVISTATLPKSSYLSNGKQNQQLTQITKDNLVSNPPHGLSMTLPRPDAPIWTVASTQPTSNGLQRLQQPSCCIEQSILPMTPLVIQSPAVITRNPTVQRPTQPFTRLAPYFGNPNPLHQNAKIVPPLQQFVEPHPNGDFCHNRSIPSTTVPAQTKSNFTFSSTGDFLQSQSCSVPSSTVRAQTAIHPRFPTKQQQFAEPHPSGDIHQIYSLPNATVLAQTESIPQFSTGISRIMSSYNLTEKISDQIGPSVQQMPHPSSHWRHRTPQRPLLPRPHTVQPGYQSHQHLHQDIPPISTTILPPSYTSHMNSRMIADLLDKRKPAEKLPQNKHLGQEQSQTALQNSASTSGIVPLQDSVVISPVSELSNAPRILSDLLTHAQSSQFSVISPLTELEDAPRIPSDLSHPQCSQNSVISPVSELSNMPRILGDLLTQPQSSQDSVVTSPLKELNNAPRIPIDLCHPQSSQYSVVTSPVSEPSNASRIQDTVLSHPQSSQESVVISPESKLINAPSISCTSTPQSSEDSVVTSQTNELGNAPLVPNSSVHSPKSSTSPRTITESHMNCENSIRNNESSASGDQSKNGHVNTLNDDDFLDWMLNSPSADVPKSSLRQDLNFVQTFEMDETEPFKSSTVTDSSLDSDSESDCLLIDDTEVCDSSTVEESATDLETEPDCIVVDDTDACDASFDAAKSPSSMPTLTPELNFEQGCHFVSTPIPAQESDVEQHSSSESMPTLVLELDFKQDCQVVEDEGDKSVSTESATKSKDTSPIAPHGMSVNKSLMKKSGFGRPC